MPARPHVVLALLTSAALVAGCTVGAGGDADPSHEPTPPGTGTGDAGATRDACRGDVTDAPADAGVGRVPDLDGDGRPDRVWVGADGSTRLVGVITAAGGGDVLGLPTASPVPLSAVVVDVDLQPPTEILVSDNRTVWLFVFDECGLQPVVGSDGTPWIFDLGFRGTGTGVGCLTDEGGRALAGLNITDTRRDAVEWTRTVVRLDGARATAGPTETGVFRQPEGAGAIELLHTVACGDVTIGEDGIHQPHG